MPGCCQNLNAETYHVMHADDDLSASSGEYVPASHLTHETFKGPFTEAGNGFFGAWLGGIFSVMLMLMAFGIAYQPLELPKASEAVKKTKAPEVGRHAGGA